MRILVTGREGQLVRSLVERAPMDGVTIVSLGRPALDLETPAAAREAILAAEPDVVVNAAAYTAVDQAETDRDRAYAVNGAGAGAVAEAAAQIRVPVVHLSTDYVFDGTKDAPYTEDDPVCPIGVYGASKLAGEEAVAAATPHHAILRTAWVYAPFGKNFVRTMLALGRSRDEIRVVADQRGCPTYAPDLAAGVIAVARNLAARPDEPDLRGVFHLCGSGETTWAAFASAIFERVAERGGHAPRVIPIATSEYPTPARRPANSELDCGKIARRHGVRLPDWRLSLAVCLDRLLSVDEHPRLKSA